MNNTEVVEVVDDDDPEKAIDRWTIEEALVQMIDQWRSDEAMDGTSHGSVSKRRSAG